MSKADDLIKAAYSLSDALHRMEASGVEFPGYLDDAWANLTTALQAFSCKGCKHYERGICKGLEAVCKEFRHA